MNSAIVIASDKFRFTDTGLQIRPDVTYEEWAEFGRGLSKRYSIIQWAIGDWINYGENKFGEMYSQALNDTDYAYGTLRNYASICARIPVENRSPKLRFHQTKHVAPLEPIEQRKIIEFAAAHDMTGDDILEAVQKITGKGKRQADTIQGVISEVDWHSNKITIELSESPDFITGQSVTIKAIK